ncbi:PF11992 domain protein [Bacteriovorax sp. BSW11_IV]|uniref:transglutaminase family protein n=1 Tax=Bacteriovorax sp. BSW11_IV TaxID=1353529 RepID=UPI000389EE75|nr:DUF3488 and transglutaminase-like domain-containing protein [Bacteriovorax sp. BSW11_IV]EQC48962.1 PF11992 domain protein [Bacteriovorax sp. BSW11_IV]
MVNRINLFSLILPLMTYIPFAWDKPIAENLFLLTGFIIGTLVLFKKIQFHPKFSAIGLIVGIVFYALTYGKFKSLEGGIFFLSYLSVIKLLEMKSVRDFYLLILILILSLVGHMLHVESLFFLFYGIGLLVVMFYSMIAVRFAGRFNNFELKKLISYFVYSIPLALLLFFIFPRFKFHTGNLGLTPEIGQTGFSEEFNPGSIANLVQTDEVVFRARFKGHIPPIPELYWRGMTYDISKGLSWERGRIHLDRPIRAENLENEYSIDFENRINGTIFTLGHANNIWPSSAGRIQSKNGSTFTFVAYGRERIRFRAENYMIEGFQNDGIQMSRYLQLPKGHDKLKEFMVKNFKKDNELQSINSFLSYLANNDYLYSMNPGGLTGLEQFFFESKKGFCEHYAALMAFALRSLDIPSRIVTGYQGGDFNALGDYFIIREKDAHAWVEGWIKGKGWVRFDPVNSVAPDRLRIGASSYYDQILLSTDNAVVRMLKVLGLSDVVLMADSLFFNLNTYFVNFDKEAQDDLFKSLFGRKLKGRDILIITLVAIGLFIGVLFFINRTSRNKIYFYTRKIAKSLEGKSRVPWIENESLMNYLERVESTTGRSYEEFNKIITIFNECYFSANSTKSDFVRMKKEIKSFLRTL